MEIVSVYLDFMKIIFLNVSNAAIHANFAKVKVLYVIQPSLDN